MSTNINVNVELSNLLRQNREDAAANRLAGAERRSAAVAGQSGKRARDVERAAQGKDPATGNTQFGVKRIGAPFEEPSAYISRRDLAGFCYVPSETRYLYSMDETVRVERPSYDTIFQPPWLFIDEDYFDSRYPLTYEYLRSVYYDWRSEGGYRGYLLPLGHKLGVLVQIGAKQDVVAETWNKFPIIAPPDFPGGAPTYADGFVDGAPMSSEEYFIEEGQTYEYYIQYKEWARVLSAYLVSESGIREIAMPARVAHILNTYIFPPIKPVLTTVSRFADGPTGTFKPADIVDPDQPGYPYFVDTLGLLQEWGTFGFSVTTPAIYDFFNNPLQVLQQFNTQAEAIEARGNYQNVRSLLSRPNMAGKHIYADSYELAAGNGYLQWTGALPATWDQRPLPGNPKYRVKQPRGTFPERTKNISGYVSYDWGNPAYCRSQLLSLGFSQSDLTP